MPRMAAKAAKTSGVDDGHGRRHEQDPGRTTQPTEWRDALATAFHEGRAGGREERHVGTEAGGDGPAGVLVELGAPQVRDTIERRVGVGRPAAEARRDRDPLLEPGRDRRRRCGTAGPATTDGPPGRRDRP